MLKIKCGAALFISVVTLFFATACAYIKTPQIYYSDEYFGASVKAVVYTDKSCFNEMSVRFGKTLKDVSNLLGADEKTSDIYRFNEAPDGYLTQISETAYALIEKAKNVYELTEGAFNPCVYYLTDLWGFSKRISQGGNSEVYDRVFNSTEYYLPLPEQKYIDAFKELSDFDNVILSKSDDKFFAMKSGTKTTLDGIDYYLKLDLGGIAKGYAVEQLNAVFEDLRITKGYISYGTSSLKLFDNAKGEPWELSLTNPRYDQTQTSGAFTNETYLKLNSEGYVSTSGDNEKYYMIDGRRYCHIMDSNTGEPINNGMVTATVFGSDSVVCDMLSTAVMVMGKERSLDFFSNSDYCKKGELKVVFVHFDGNEYEVCGTREFTIIDDGFKKSL